MIDSNILLNKTVRHNYAACYDSYLDSMLRDRTCKQHLKSFFLYHSKFLIDIESNVEFRVLMPLRS